MLLSWLSQDATDHDQDEQDEASVALLPKISDDKLPRGGIFQKNSEDDIGSLAIESKKLPWWSYIWDYDPKQTPQEQKFVQKLDIYLLTILSLATSSKT